VHAVDIDPLAVAATGENAARNGVAVTPLRADALSDVLPAAPLWVANLERRLLEPLLRRDSLPGELIVSGLLSDEPFDHSGWRALARADRDGWRALRLVRP
jgi:ribosomal protein L11 methylase PrmA